MANACSHSELLARGQQLADLLVLARKGDHVGSAEELALVDHHERLRHDDRRAAAGRAEVGLGPQRLELNIWFGIVNRARHVWD